MIEKLKKLYKKYREPISYIFFGGLTTLVSWGSYFLLVEWLSVNYLIAQVVSWIAAVAFAFVTNKLFVFEDRDSSGAGLLRQIAGFVGVRLASGAIETGLLFVAVELLHGDESISKVIVSVITVIINYFASKLMIFGKTSGNNDDKA